MAIAIRLELWNFPALRSEPPRPLTGPPLLTQGGEKAMDRAGLIPSLAKEGWREAPGWFEAAIPQLRVDSYIYPLELHLRKSLYVRHHR